MAKFWCPKTNEYTLEIVHSVSVTPTNPLSSDEMIQTVFCPQSGFKGMALYKESHAGALDRDEANHDAFELDDESYAAANELLEKIEQEDESAKNTLQTLYETHFAEGPIRIKWNSIFPMNVEVPS